MPPSNHSPTTRIGMTITTTSASPSAVVESKQRRKSRMWRQLMQHPPPPPPISSVVIRSQSTKARRSMTTSSTEDIYEDEDDDDDDDDDGSVSSCSMEVMSVNAPYEYYFHDSMEAWSRQEQNHSSSNTFPYGSGDSQEEEDSTADSTGSGSGVDHPAYLAYYHHDDPESRGPSTRPRRRSQGKPQPQQMARILACSSPEITALCKSSFQQQIPTSMEHHHSTRRLRLPVQQQPPPPPQAHCHSDDEMSIGTQDDDALVDEPSTERRMESCGTAAKHLSLPPPPNGPPPIIHGEQTASQSSPVRSDYSIPRQSNLPLPNWMDVWLREHRDAEAPAAELIPSSSSEADDPYVSFRSSSDPPIMFHYSDSLIGGPVIPSHQHATLSPNNRTKKFTMTITTRTLPPPEVNHHDNAVVDPLSKLSLHRRVSIDQLPSWHEIADRNTTTTSPDTDTLQKSVLRKTVTAVSDESMR